MRTWPTLAGMPVLNLTLCLRFRDEAAGFKLDEFGLVRDNHSRTQWTSASGLGAYFRAKVRDMTTAEYTKT